MHSDWNKSILGIISVVLLCVDCFATIQSINYGDKTWTETSPGVYRYVFGGSSTSAPPTPSSDLVLQYLMGANTNTAVITKDTSGNDRHGTVSGADWVEATNGIASSYFFIEGNDDYIYRDDESALDFTSNLTMSAWVNPGGTDAQFIIAKDTVDNRSYSMYLETSLAPKAQIFYEAGGYDTTSASNAIIQNAWSHMVTTYDASANETRIYIDGVIQGIDATGNGNIKSAGAQLQIGRRQYTGATSPYDGYITKVELLDTVWDADTILETNIVQGTELGISERFFLDNRNLRSNNVMDVQHGNLVQDGGQYRIDGTTASAPTASGTNQFLYDGNNNIYTFPYDANMALCTNGLTAIIWVKPASANLGSDEYIFGQWDVTGNERTWIFMIESDDDEWYFRNSGSGGYDDAKKIDTGVDITTNWTHLAVTTDNTATPTGKFYVNGSLVATNYNVLGQFEDFGSDLTIGGISAGLNFEGRIGKNLVNAEVWSDADITNHFDYTKGVYGL